MRTTGLNAFGAMAYAALFSGPLWGMYSVEHRNEALRLSVLASAPTPDGGWRWEEDEPKPLYEVTPDGSTAIIPIVGILLPDCEAWLTRYGYCSCHMAQEAALAASLDANITTLVFRIKSPGGRVDGVLELAQTIRAIRDAGEKDVLAYIDGMGCSCAYWIASQCRRIYTNETGIAGSLGTILTILDFSAYYREMGVVVNPIVSDGAETYKPAGLMGTALTDEQKADLKRLVNETNAVFQAQVQSGRGWTTEQTTTLFDGRVHVGTHAKTLKLIDGITSLIDLLAGYLPEDLPCEDEGDDDESDDEAGKKPKCATPARANPPRKGNPMSLMDRILGALRQEGYKIEKAAPAKPGAVVVPAVTSGNSGGEPSALEAELARLREAENGRLVARRAEVEACAVRAFGSDATRLTQARAAIAAATGDVLEALAAAYEAAVPTDLRPGATRVSSGVQMDGAAPAAAAPSAEDFSVTALQQHRTLMEKTNGKGK